MIPPWMGHLVLRSSLIGASSLLIVILASSACDTRHSGYRTFTYCDECGSPNWLIREWQGSASSRLISGYPVTVIPSGRLGTIARTPPPRHMLAVRPLHHELGKSELVVDQVGWPCPALYCVSIPASTGTLESSLRLGGIVISRAATTTMPADGYRVIPLRPIWGGLLLDVCLFSTLGGGLATTFVSLRRLRRRSQGHCPRCGYDLRFAFVDGCSECGWNKPH
jgi:hypothetical protein